MELKELILATAGLMSVSGYERYEHDKLTDLLNYAFDSDTTDRLGNRILVKKCGRSDAPRILVDTHFDEIGMIVTGIYDGGFLTVTNIGGVDTRILQASEVVIYGKEKIRGVVASTPPHLQKAGDAKKLKEINELYIDTGYPKEELEKIAPLGTPIGFVPRYAELMNDKICGKGFDDKACVACAVKAISETPSEDLAGDVYLMLSSFEETSALGGATAGAFGIDPDYAMVVDVSLGRMPDTKKVGTTVVGNGPSLTISALTNRRLTKLLASEADAKEIKYQYDVAPSSTGTNTAPMHLVGRGIPTVDVGLPLKYMHTCVETISLKDAEELVKMIKAFISSSNIAEVFKYE